jgi:hypothetical protein
LADFGWFFVLSSAIGHARFGTDAFFARVAAFARHSMLPSKVSFDMSKAHAGTPQIADPPRPGQNPPAPGGRRSILAREGVVRVAVAGCILLVLAMMALLWQHWSNVREPTTAILVHGDSSLDGARINVESADDPAESKVNVTLDQDRKFQQAIFRYPGQYRVTIRYPSGPTVSYMVTIDHRRGAVLDLPTTVTVIAQPGDKVTLINRDGASQSATYDSKNTKAIFLLMPGKYILQRTRGAAPLPPEEVTIDAHVPRQIELPKME